jgi:hypothetical protein
MNEADTANGGRKICSAKGGEKIGKKCEEWGDNLEIKVGALEKKIPRPLNALLDALCITVIVAMATWACAKIGWIDSMPSLAAFAIVFCALFGLSVFYRLFMKSKK